MHPFDVLVKGRRNLRACETPSELLRWIYQVTPENDPSEK
jgi:hypothetical protein